MNRLVTVAALLLGLSGCFYGPTPNTDGSVTVSNASSYVFTEIRVTEVSNRTWGPNLLPNLLYPNEQLTVVVACGYYDVLIVDEFARECILGSLDLCNSDQGWAIDDYTLRDCAF